MWLFTTRGFYSVVQHRDHDDRVLVRARNKGDIDGLKDLVDVKPFRLKHSDYEWRIECSREEWMRAVAQLTADIDYPNFKSAVGKHQGSARESVYMSVWSALLRIEAPGRLRSWGSTVWSYKGKGKKRKEQERLFDERPPSEPYQDCNCWIDADEGSWEEHDDECPYALDLMEREGVDPLDPYGQDRWDPDEDELEIITDDRIEAEEDVQRQKRGSRR